MKTYWVLAVLVLAFGIGVSFLSCSSSGGGDDDSGGDDDDATDDNVDDDTGDDDSTDDDVDDDVDDEVDDEVDDDTGDVWTDSSSGLTWQVTPSSDYMPWDDAKTYCDNLTLAGGGWHLPTISELRTLIRGCDGTVTGGSCGVTDSCLDYSCEDETCTACTYGGGPNNGCYGPSELPGECGWYWSSSPVADSANYAWRVGFPAGDVNDYNTGISNYYGVHCVRP